MPPDPGPHPLTAERPGSLCGRGCGRRPGPPAQVCLPGRSILPCQAEGGLALAEHSVGVCAGRLVSPSGGVSWVQGAVWLGTAPVKDAWLPVVLAPQPAVSARPPQTHTGHARHGGWPADQGARDAAVAVAGARPGPAAQAGKRDGGLGRSAAGEGGAWRLGAGGVGALCVGKEGDRDPAGEMRGVKCPAALGRHQFPLLHVCPTSKASCAQQSHHLRMSITTTSRSRLGRNPPSGWRRRRPPWKEPSRPSRGATRPPPGGLLGGAVMFTPAGHAPSGRSAPGCAPPRETILAAGAHATTMPCGDRPQAYPSLHPSSR